MNDKPKRGRPPKNNKDKELNKLTYAKNKSIL
jgi:hypothetical protein